MFRDTISIYPCVNKESSDFLLKVVEEANIKKAGSKSSTSNIEDMWVPYLHRIQIMLLGLLK